jgi:hypothetical protein
MPPKRKTIKKKHVDEYEDIGFEPIVDENVLKIRRFMLIAMF